VNTKSVIDVSKLPTSGFGPQAPLWWGMWGLFAIEGTMIALVLASYFYLRLSFKDWPPPNFGFPALGPGTVNTAVLIASIFPMAWVHRSALNDDQRKVQIGMVSMSVIGVIAVAIRCYEFPALKTHWADHAYGSVVWAALGVHMFHLIASTGENILLAVYTFLRDIDEKHQLDLAVNAMYWYFVVAIWIPIYVIIYYAPRWLN
jgi:heme/copper-type cytochrome/quinol oxidase subunit 3